MECGIGLENFNDVKVGDVIEAYVVEKVHEPEVTMDTWYRPLSEPARK